MHTVHRKRRCRVRVKPRFWALVLALSLCVAGFAAVGLHNSLRVYSEAKWEYDNLRLAAPPVLSATPDTAVEEAPAGAAPTPGQAQPMPTATPSLSDVNPEYTGWLEVMGTGISYPMAQGEDNDKYLHTTFSGEENKLGAIFLDARCVDGLAGQHTIIYGHNAKDGSMFAGLSALLDAEAYPDITITLPEGEVLTYRIFAVRQSDIRDFAYRWEFEDAADFAAFADGLGAPEGSERIITLSTCSDTGGRDGRLLVHAALVEDEG